MNPLFLHEFDLFFTLSLFNAKKIIHNIHTVHIYLKSHFYGVFRQFYYFFLKNVML